MHSAIKEMRVESATELKQNGTALLALYIMLQDHFKMKKDREMYSLYATKVKELYSRILAL